MVHVHVIINVTFIVRLVVAITFYRKVLSIRTKLLTNILIKMITLIQSSKPIIDIYWLYMQIFLVNHRQLLPAIRFFHLNQFDQQCHRRFLKCSHLVQTTTMQ